MAKSTFATKPDLIVIGFDSEYVYKSEVDPDHNQVLSYQYYGKTTSGAWQGIVHTEGPDLKHRLKLKDLIGRAIEHGRDEGILGKKWPKVIYAVAHFTRADLAGFKDFSDLKTKFDNVRNSWTTITDPYKCTYTDRNRNQRNLEIHLRDTTHLAPPKFWHLKDLGELLQLEKIELPKSAIKQMDSLRQSDPELFERYAIRDAEIAAEYLWRIVEFSADNGIGNTPALTVGSLAVNYLIDLWDRTQIRKTDVLGTEEAKQKQWNPHTRRHYTKKEFPLIKEIHLHEPLAVESYHGGRNEAFMFGFTDLANWIDVDLSGAYTTAMAAIKVPDYKNIKISSELADYKKDTLGVAQIRFKFPSDKKYPCLPVRTDHGLVFPLEGETYVASPEIELALSLNAEIKIEYGVVIPWLNEVRPFEQFSKSVREHRDVEKEAGRKGGLFELLWKDMGNSVYGKTAQGLRKKRVYDSRTDQSADLPPSKVTQPFLAAYTTSIIRAVLGELLATLPTDSTLVSVTTDGFLYNGELKDLNTSGPLSQFFADLAGRVKGERDFLEIKHNFIPQILCCKTRGQASVGILPPTMKTLLAKAGVSPPKKVFETAEDGYVKEFDWCVDSPDYQIPIDLKDFTHNSYLLDLFLNRTADTKITTTSFISMRDMARFNKDLIEEVREVSLNMDFDWKRELVDPRMVFVGDSRLGNPEHITLSSRPWKNVEQFKLVRKLFDQWRYEKNAVLKTLEDWKDWCDFKEYHVLRSEGHYTGRGAPVEQYKRWFLNMYSNRHYDLNGGKYAELAAWLTSNGHPTTVQQIKDAKRSKGVSLVSPPLNVAEVKDLHELLLARYPTLPTT
jgi:hypothetical protein